MVQKHYQNYLKLIDDKLSINNNPQLVEDVVNSLNSLKQKYNLINYDKENFVNLFNAFFESKIRISATEGSLELLQSNINIFFDHSYQSKLDKLSQKLNTILDIWNVIEDDEIKECMSEFYKEVYYSSLLTEYKIDQYIEKSNDFIECIEELKSSDNKLDVLPYKLEYFASYYMEAYNNFKRFALEPNLYSLKNEIEDFVESYHNETLGILTNKIERLIIIKNATLDNQLKENITELLENIKSTSYFYSDTLNEFSAKIDNLIDYHYNGASSASLLIKKSTSISENVNENLISAVDKWSNSFLRPLIPPRLLSSSTIIQAEDDGAKLIYAKFLYGEKTGKPSTRPFSGSYVDKNDKIKPDSSLWDYSISSEKVPDGFVSSKSDGGYISTGNVQKCRPCRGQGDVTCTKCNGRIRWTEKQGDNYVEKHCSCGNGKQICSNCDGFGNVEDVIVVENIFNVYETKNSQYSGEVPEVNIKKITGQTIFEEIFEYPKHNVKEILREGVTASEFNELNNAVLDKLRIQIDYNLHNKGVDTQKIHQQMNALFNTVPNPAKENKLMTKEMMPIRVMVKVEDAPVTQINYQFKENDYSIWVFGNENSVWYQKIPFSFNYKLILIIVALITIIGLLIFYNK